MGPNRALIENAEKKLREASSSLEQMIERERMAFVDKEKFDFHLSGLLSAGMSVRGAFHVKQNRKANEAVKKWKINWVWANGRGKMPMELHAAQPQR
jgi:hypothetical protein